MQFAVEGLEKHYVKKLPKKRVGKSKRDCVVCYETFAEHDLIRILPCKHYFHYGCLKPWFEANTSCPVCRFDVRKFFEDDDE